MTMLGGLIWEIKRGENVVYQRAFQSLETLSFHSKPPGGSRNACDVSYWDLILQILANEDHTVKNALLESKQKTWLSPKPGLY